MPKRNTVKAIVLSVLIVTGSAVSSEADGRVFFQSGFLTSSFVTLTRESVQWVQSLIWQGRNGVLFVTGR